MAATLIEYSLATVNQFAEISAAGNTPQVITADQVGAARQEGVSINGTT